MSPVTVREIPQFIGKYKIHSLIATGGMGAVYKAIHPDLKRPVIIKKLAIKRNSMVLERFKREAKILLDLNNPHIVHMFDYFKEGTSHYLVLEFVDGMSLDKLIEKKKNFSEQLALLITLDIAQALKYAHERGIIHRDVKPGNILLSKHGEVKLADFGIAASEQDRSSEALNEIDKDKTIEKSGIDLTMAGSSLGTPSYMSPEQFTDSSRVDKRTDIYSLGVMLYELLTGEKPFKTKGLSLGEILNERQKRFPNPRKIKPKLPFKLVRLIKRMTKAKPEKRFQDLQPVIKRIKAYLKKYDTHQIRVSMVKAMLTKKTDEPEYPKKRNPFLQVTAGFLLGVLIIAGGYYAWKNDVFYKTIFRPWFSPVTITIELPQKILNSSEMVYSILIFKDDNDAMPEVKRARKTMETVNSEKKTSVTSGEIWLMDGKYRAKIMAGPRIWWKSFSVDGKKLNLYQDFGRIRPRNLRIYTSAKDARNGQSLAGKAYFSVLKDNQWVLLSEKVMEDIYSGTVWKFRAQAPGYKTMIYSLRIDWYQDELILEAQLEPEE